MKLSIIIVSYNTKDLLRKCLNSLKGYDTEIIVVDNNSQDDSQSVVKKEFPDVHLIINDDNLGFAKANNQGIKIATGDYVLLLNSDTQVKPGALEKLVEFAKSHLDAGVIGARLLNQDGSIQPSIYRLPTITNAIKEFWLGQLGLTEKYFIDSSKGEEVEAVVGAVFLIPKTVIQKVGLLDERYFMYFEDLDYCRRVRRAGYKVYYFPKAEVFHYHGASGKKIGNITNQWLIQSSKIYHGKIKYLILTVIIFTGQKWQKIIRKRY
ncbi:glycosyl transferase family 2 [Candidatus Shapirobacteria bacterium CG08_land_8_20_14_0_20_39_18]|uniref:Glycosyl transferase family 2 n=1 Tax=Candidatus Shapirobacteria bacterium CG08_land_8_20_14_0_20_39_18 TaxID=1974883 RepID=A0A2M6XDX9_9BACT|nr:MAG: glycosyl transferase family 2 [Candidatus Shapirobacteria bacterium CG08_land_8_20_14_0_20_39_18]PJE68624.1 MAG: glycosyl transferase family 2 [Candidatus Shapirobacteria bacterium CG10_big_fil_rev_8_21_14_0_10_38_8]